MQYYDKKASGICIVGGCKNIQSQTTMCEFHKKKRHDYHEEFRTNLKRNVLEAYGGAICIACGEIELTVLCIDHINGGGHKEHIKYNSKGGWTFYHKLMSENYPRKDQYQVLCANCNQCKLIETDII